MVIKKEAKVMIYCIHCGSKIEGDTNRKYAFEEAMLEDIYNMTNSELLKVTAKMKNEKARALMKSILKNRLK